MNRWSCSYIHVLRNNWVTILFYIVDLISCKNIDYLLYITNDKFISQVLKNGGLAPPPPPVTVSPVDFT